MKSIAILGAGGHGAVVAETALSCGWSKITFFDDNADISQKKIKIEGDSRLLEKHVKKFDGIHIAIGDNDSRMEKILFFQSLGINSEIIVHPSAVVSPSAIVQSGAALLAGVVVCANAKIGYGTILNTSSTIDHDCNIGKGCHISPGVNIAGNVVIGDNTWVGIGSSVIQNITIGSSVVIGANSAVIENIEDKKTAVGVPCKVIN